MGDVRQGGGLQTIFAIFLGLMVTAFVGVGVYTFYPSPQRLFDSRTEELNRQEQAIRIAKPENELTPADRARIQEITDDRNKTLDAVREAHESWGRSTSIILIAFATFVMAISLVRAEPLPVISNGLLLGGVFTMVYGVGWIIATNTSVARFIVMTVALVITVGLGYLRFVRGQAPAAVQRSSGTAAAEGLADLAERVGALEQRMNDAASALGEKKR